jgi:hypothetical protein
MKTIQEQLVERIYEILPHKKEAKEKLLETLADIEHTRWSKWQKWLHSKCWGGADHNMPEVIMFSRFDFDRWERQIATPYSELSEQEKESDRVESRVTISAIEKSDDGVLRLADLLLAIGKVSKPLPELQLFNIQLDISKKDSNGRDNCLYNLSQDNILFQSDEFCKWALQILK